MNVRERVEALRKLMKNNGMDAYIIPSSDPHQSEYVADHWKARTWISGFTGSAGTAVITQDDAGLWTDGRYFIQAEKQLSGSGIRLFKMAQPGVLSYDEWIMKTLKKGSCVGFDGKLFSASKVKEMRESFLKEGIEINKEHDLISILWEDRPQIPLNPIIIHDTKYAGKSAKEKLDIVRDEMKKNGTRYYLIGSLDDIAWLYNIRGRDVSNNPVVTSYALVSIDEGILFIDEKKVPDDVKSELSSNGIKVMGYEKITSCLEKLGKDDSILLDPERINSSLYDSIGMGCKIVEEPNVTTKLKAVKNDVEIENMKRCHVKDGVAMVKFLYWLDENLGNIEITEISASDKLEEFRGDQEHFVETSFDTIAGYKDHAAMMHYKASSETQYSLKKEGMLLVDSGGQYLDGTTDITRTIVLGPLTDEEKRDFTLTLKGHIGLSRAKFLYGSTGSNLDILARLPLWEQGIDYKCGTGHGIGFFLNVHEGPQGFRQTPNKVVLEKGMIVTNEPGVYKEGKHGIRTENVILVVEDEKTESGQFMSFETISYCPIDIDGIDASMLSHEEKMWLNNYHSEVFKKISPYLTDSEREWLKIETREI